MSQIKLLELQYFSYIKHFAIIVEILTDVTYFDMCILYLLDFFRRNRQLENESLLILDKFLI